MKKLFVTILKSMTLLFLFSVSSIAQNLPSVLINTSWHLQSFQSMDDAIGTIIPDDPSHYTMMLRSDGTVTMQLNCNRAMGTWNATPSSEGSSGQFTFGPLAMTKMLCPPPSMDTKIAADASYVRSFLLKDGNLYLSLMADGGIYAWEPDSPSDIKAPASPEDGGARYWKVTETGKVTLYESASTTSSVIATYTPGTILNNLGCQLVQHKSWCDVQEFGGGPRGYVETTELRPLAASDGKVITGANMSALRAGEEKFDVTGQIDCSIGNASKTTCEYGIARDQGGDATVVVKKPDGVKRAIFFQLGKPMSADTSQADGYPPFKSNKKNGLYLISVGNEHYEIPETVILGE